MVKFKLNHTCNLSGSKGVAGDIIDVTQERADFLLSRKGGSIVEPTEATEEGHAQGAGDKSESKPTTGKKGSNK